MHSLIGLDLAQLERLAAQHNEPAFRAKQLHQWLYVHCARTFEDMNNLSKAFRATLAEHYQVSPLTLATTQTSSDGTVKYLFRLADGLQIESVLMHFEERGTYSVCISSQVGCAVDCSFCATGKLGFSRNLTTAEIVAQYLFIQGHSGKELRNVVLMGQGEPLLNYDNVLAAIKMLNADAEVGMRRITLSTSGIVPKIEALAKENLQLTLAISLHATHNILRDELVPVNKKWPLELLIPALRQYVSHTGRRLTVEYILIAGLNDSAQQAKALAQLLQGLRCNVNLIPYNPIACNPKGYERPSRETVLRFMHLLNAAGRKTTVRLERGADIAAACGQLALAQKDAANNTIDATLMTV